ncbi:MAG: hypothetical protein HDS52_03215 [Barnesiella sp.]|nr:hypothetical protein [Barnesiella sp.]
MRRVATVLVASMLGAVTHGGAAAPPSELDCYLAAAAGTSESITAIDAETLFAGRGLAAIEGVWRISGSEGMMAIAADPGSIFYRMILVESPDRTQRPGTVMGALTALGRKDSYDAMIFTSADDGNLGSPKRFTVTITDDGHLTITPVTDGLKLNLWRMLPYMFRNVVTRVNDRPNNLDGALRVYPLPALPPEIPRYL